MEDDDSSIELVYEENLDPAKVKKEDEDEDNPMQNVEESSDEEECFELEERSENENDINQDKDPMDLLELLDKQSVEDEEEKTNTTDNEDELESITGIETDDQKLHELMVKYEWCFKDSDNANRAWCLFCNAVLKSPTPARLSNHANTTKHKERAEEYLAFLSKLDKDKYRLTSNIGYEGDVKEAKTHRQTLEKDFSNYLWDKWEEEHDWLIRTNECFIAYCKYCHLKIAVSNLRARKLHEDSSKHKEFKGKAPKRRATICGDLQSFQSENFISDQESNSGNRSLKDDGNISEFSDKWYEKSKSSSDLCRCKLCDITMFQASYIRHTNSNLHRQNLCALGTPGVSDKLVKPDWGTIQKDHEWIMEDPIDCMEGYCKYCEKRLGYASSAAKRLIHEHSASHRAAVQNFNRKGPNTQSENEIKTDCGNDGNIQKQEESDGQDEGGENEDNIGDKDSNTKSVQKRKRRRNRKEHTVEFPWAKPYRKDSRYFICQFCKVLLRRENFSGKKHAVSARHQQLEKQYLEQLTSKMSHKTLSDTPIRANETFYPWLVKFKGGVDYVYCKYCNFRFSRKANRALHQKTQRHINAEKAMMENLSAEKYMKESIKKECDTPVQTHRASKSNGGEKQSPVATKADIKNMKAKILEWQKRFSWLKYEKGLLLNYGHCTYCEKSVFMPSPGYATKHQKTSPHIRARNEKRKQQRRKQQEFQNAEYTVTEETDSEKSLNSSSGQNSKCYKPSSLKTAIETAKRLTAAHLDMMSFMQNNAQKPNDLIQMVKWSAVKSVPPPPSSPSVDSSVGMLMSRNPFDLFFNSMSETLKRLPPDLASEGKLKVMQIIFDLEIRAQQRQNQKEAINTSSTSHNMSILNSSNEKACANELPEEADKLNNNQFKQQQSPEFLIQNHHNQTLQQQKHQQQIIREESQQNHPNIYNSVKRQHNSILQQQLSQPQKPITQQPPIFVMQGQSNSTQRSQYISSPQLKSKYSQHEQRNVLLKTSPNLGRVIQHDSSQRNQILLKQHRTLSKMNFNNLNQHLNINNNAITYSTTNTPTTITTPKRNLTNSHGIYLNDFGNNNAPSPTKMPLIRPVPISSLTQKKYKSSDEPAIHHIQLNSSTQSKIIPLDTHKGMQK